MTVLGLLAAPQGGGRLARRPVQDRRAYAPPDARLRGAFVTSSADGVGKSK